MKKYISYTKTVLPLLTGLFGILGSFSSTLNRDILSLRLFYFIIIYTSCFFIYRLTISLGKKSLEYILFLTVSAIITTISITFLVKMVMAYFTLDMTLESNNYKALNLIKNGAFFSLPAILLLSFYNLSELFTKQIKKLQKLSKSEFGRLTIAALILLFGNIILYSPISVLTSSHGTFSIELVPTILYYIGITAVTVIVFFFALKLLNTKRRTLIVTFLIVGSITTWIYTYLIPGDFGNLDGTILTEAIKLNIGSGTMLLELTSITLFLIIFYIIYLKKTKLIFPIVIILNLMSLSQTVSGVLSYINSSKDATTENVPTSLDSNLFSFSKDKNVIVIMIDMFCGGYIPNILEEEPALKIKLDGFTWYPNTLSISNNTFTSVPSMVGGSNYKPGVMNTRGIKLKDQFQDAYLEFSNKMGPEGFNVAMGGLYYLRNRQTMSDNNIAYFTNREIYSEWKSKPENNGIINTLLSPNEFRNIFIVIGLFKAAPFLLKSTIYYDSRWLNANRGGMTIDHVLESKALFDLLPIISTTDSTKSTFKYFANNLSHMPWGIDDNGELNKDYIVDTPEFVKIDGVSYINPELVTNSLKTTLNLLTEWFKWMKDAGVYNNTKIILVSDHGNSGLSPMFGNFKQLKDSAGTPIFPTGRIHPLMMVKDFNTRGDLKISDKFLSNSDTYDIATSVTGSHDPINNYNPDRELTMYATTWKLSDNKADSYSIIAEYTVTKSIFNSENWTLK